MRSACARRNCMPGWTAPGATALISRDGDGRWVANDGRRSSAVSEALLWALISIAKD